MGCGKNSFLICLSIVILMKPRAVSPTDSNEYWAGYENCIFPSPAETLVGLMLAVIQCFVLDYCMQCGN